MIQLPYAKTFCIPEIFLELVHCPCQKASYILSLGYSGKGEYGSIKDTNKTTPCQVQKRQNASNYGNHCHGVVRMTNAALPCVALGKVKMEETCPASVKNKQKIVVEKVSELQITGD